jgi:hypothetical protein
MAGEFVFRLSDGKIREVREYADTALVDAVLGDPAFPAVPFHIPASA